MLQIPLCYVKQYPLITNKQDGRYRGFRSMEKAEMSFEILSEDGDSMTTLKDIRIGLHAGLITNNVLLLDIYTSIFVHRDPCRRISNHILNSRLKWLGFATKYIA